MPAQNFEDLIEELMPKVYGYFFRRCEDRSAVDDLAMNTLLKLYEKIQGDKIENPYAYCWQIAKHELYEYWRKKGKFIEYPSDNTDYTESPEFMVWQQLLLEDIQRSVSHEEYQLLYLYIGEGRRAEELAVIYATNANNIRKKCSRLLQKVRTKLSSRYDQK